MRMLRQRPISFLLKSDHPLAKGLVFAGLGRCHNSLRYQDSSPYGRHGTLVNMEPATAWQFSTELGRWVVYLDGLNSGDYLSLPGLANGTYSVAFWGHNTATETYSYLFDARVSGGTGWCYVTNGNGAIVIPAGDGQIRYVNGVPSSTDSATLAHYAVTGITLNATTLIFGAENSLRADQRYKGTIADITIWNRVLSTAEIQQLADPSNVMLSGLILPPKRKYYGITIPLYTTKRYYKIGKRILRA